MKSTHCLLAAGEFVLRASCLLFAVVSLGCAEKSGMDEAATLFTEAKAAVDAGDSAKAIELLDQSIASRPDPWYYHLRAKLHAENGDDELAKADIEAGLELDPENDDLTYIQKELRKPVKSRFKKAPPMASK